MNKDTQTPELTGLAALMQAAENQDKTTKVEPQVCNLDDTECLTCSG